VARGDEQLKEVRKGVAIFNEQTLLFFFLKFGFAAPELALALDLREPLVTLSEAFELPSSDLLRSA
jgi:hypothetical protein